MNIPKIILKRDKVLIQPTQEASSSFSTEQKKYERKALAIVKGIGEGLKVELCEVEVGDKVIYDDSHSIDFSIDGVSLSIISPEDIVATIEEVNNG